MMRQPGEPSVEDILDSIKRVIARDNRVNAAFGDAQLRQPMVASGGYARDDVLDLGVSAQFLDPADSCVANDDDETESEPALVTDDTRASMRESLAALAMLAQPSTPPQIVKAGETSLEGMVRDLLKPALAEWLDKNLPPIVEKMVAAEIARIVGKKL